MQVWAIADKDHSGFIELAEVQLLIRHLNGGVDPSPLHLQTIFRKLDVDKSNRISYEEFLARMKDWLGHVRPGRAVLSLLPHLGPSCQL